MKKTLLFTFVAFLFIGNAYSQTYHESDKEGLRKILRYKGTDHYKNSNESITKYDVNNFETYGLTEEDTLAWNASEDWLTKIKASIVWNDETPRRIVKAGFGLGVEETHFDMSNFEKLEEISISVHYYAEYVGAITVFNKSVTANLSANVNLKTFNLKSVSLKGEYPFAPDNNIDSLVWNGITNKVLSVLPKVKKITTSSDEKVLDFSNNPELEYFNLYNNGGMYKSMVEKMDFSQCHNLKELYCSFGILKELYISDQIKMTTLDCSMNNLTLETLPYNPKDNPIIENYNAGGQKIQYYAPYMPFEYKGDLLVGDILDLSTYASKTDLRITWELFNKAEETGDGRIYDVEEVETGKFKIPESAKGDYLLANINTDKAFGNYYSLWGYKVSGRGSTVGIEAEGCEAPIKISNTVVNANEEIFVDSKAAGNAVLFSVSGKMSGQYKLVSGVNKIPVSVKGVYLLQVVLENGDSDTSKIMVK